MTNKINLNISRRIFLKTTAMSGAAVFLTKAPLQAQHIESVPPLSPTAKSDGLTYNYVGYDLWIRWNNVVALCYRAHPTQKYPYIYPVAGPITGLSLTTESALPWPHHRSLFFGCDAVNGYDFWSQEIDKGKIISKKPRITNVSKNSVTIQDNCDWQTPNGVTLMRDERKIELIIVSEKLRYIDWTIRWIAEQNINIKKTNHSLFALRASPDITPSGGGFLVNAGGDSGEKATFGKKSEWCSFYGKRRLTDVKEGIAIFDSPSNPWSPCQWFTRDYGFISPTPLNFVDVGISIEAGKAMQLKYRVVLFADTSEDIELSTLYKEWAKT